MVQNESLAVIKNLIGHTKIINRKRLILKIPEENQQPICRVAIVISESVKADTVQLINIFDGKVAKVMFEKRYSNIKLDEVFIYDFLIPVLPTYMVIDIESKLPICALVSDIRLFVKR